MREISGTPDLEYCQNNGVISLRPTATGRLKHLVAKGQGVIYLGTGEGPRGDGYGHGKFDRVWVFLDPFCYIDEMGNELVDAETRGLSVGTMEDWDRFCELCKKIGFILRSASFYVPLSNGKKESWVRRSGSKETHASHSHDEVAHCRWDLPSEAQLIKAFKA